MKRKFLIMLAVLAVACWAPAAGAITVCSGQPSWSSGTVDGTSSSGDPIASSVTFGISGSNLVITLTNHSPASMDDPTQILQGVVWQQIGTGTLTAVSAIGSNVVNSASWDGPNVDVGGEWAYQVDGVSPPLGSANMQVAGAGTYGMGNPDGTNPVFFPPTSINYLDAPPINPDGSSYGIISAGASAANISGFAQHLNNDAWGLVQDTIVFTLGLSDDFLEDSTYCYPFDNVAMFFGTSPGDVLVPIPPTALLLGSGMLGLGLLGWRRKRS